MLVSENGNKASIGDGWKLHCGACRRTITRFTLHVPFAVSCDGCGETFKHRPRGRDEIVITFE